MDKYLGKEFLVTQFALNFKFFLKQTFTLSSESLLCIISEIIIWDAARTRQYLCWFFFSFFWFSA